MRIRLWRWTSVGWAVSTGETTAWAKKSTTASGAIPLVGKLVEGVNQTAFARWRTGQIVGATAPDMVLVLGDVGQLQEIAEGANDGLRRVARQRVEEGGELGAGAQIAITGKTNRRLADALDKLKNGFAFLLAHRIAEDTAKVSDVVAEGFVLVIIERVWGHLVLSDEEYGGVRNSSKLFGH